MTQLTITIENKSIVPHLKKILNAIEGVSFSKPAKKSKKSGIEESFEDARAGRVTRYANAEEMFSRFAV